MSGQYWEDRTLALFMVLVLHLSQASWARHFISVPSGHMWIWGRYGTLALDCRTCVLMDTHYHSGSTGHGLITQCIISVMVAKLATLMV